jgi:hypothetical protein
MRQLVDYLARALVDDPAQVDVAEVQEDAGTILRVKVAKSDLGKLIGKKGRTARALRAVLAAASAKANRRFTLEIYEPPPPAVPDLAAAAAPAHGGPR